MSSKIKSLLRLLNALKVYGIKGLYFWGVYSRAILRTAPIKCGQNNEFEVHTLVCQSDLLSAIWTLKSFFYFAETRPRLVIYNDGSLNQSDLELLHHHFVNASIISRAQFQKDMEGFLKDFESSLSFTKIKSFYCSLKLFGPMLYPQKDGVLYLDSDVLFFQKPIELLKHIKNRQPFHMSDYQNFFAFPPKRIKEEFSADVIPKLNAGLFYINKNDFVDHIEFVEAYFSKVALIGEEIYDVNKHEQTLASIMLGKAGAARLSDVYQISADPITDKTVSHHFVRDGSRGAFYTRGLSRLKAAGFTSALNNLYVNRAP